MNEQPLEEALRSLVVPPPDAARREETWRSVQAELDATSKAVPNDCRGRWRLVAWTAVPIAAVLALVILVPSLLTHRHGPSISQSGFSTKDVDDSRRILHEVRTLFPDHLQAVIVDANGLNIRLHDVPTRVSDQPILVELSVPGADPVRLISYSGQTVSAMIADRRIHLDLLRTGSNSVIILGDDFIWTAQEAMGTGGLRIRAQSLEVPS